MKSRSEKMHRKMMRLSQQELLVEARRSEAIDMLIRVLPAASRTIATCGKRKRSKEERSKGGKQGENK